MACLAAVFCMGVVSCSEYGKPWDGVEKNGCFGLKDQLQWSLRSQKIEIDKISLLLSVWSALLLFCAAKALVLQAPCPQSKPESVTFPCSHDVPSERALWVYSANPPTS